MYRAFDERDAIFLRQNYFQAPVSISGIVAQSNGSPIQMNNRIEIPISGILKASALLQSHTMNTEHIKMAIQQKPVSPGIITLCIILAYFRFMYSIFDTVHRI